MTEIAMKNIETIKFLGMIVKIKVINMLDMKKLIRKNLIVILKGRKNIMIMVMINLTNLRKMEGVDLGLEIEEDKLLLGANFHEFSLYITYIAH